MTTIKDKIIEICNYKDDNLSGINTFTGLYIGFEIEDSEEYLLEQKRQNRELKINQLIFERDSDEKIKEVESKDDEFFDTIKRETGLKEWEGVIAPKVHTITYTATKFKDYDDLYDNIIAFLDSNTKKPMVYRSNVFPDTSLSNLDYDSIVRRITTKIMMGSNMIAVEGRMGPAKSALIGSNLRKYLDNHSSISNLENSGIKLIFEDNIDPDKIILCRGGKTDQEGIHVINDSDINYFMEETPHWEDQYLWFSVK